MNMRRAFTLMEINLAMLIMATGVLAVVGLYSMGFRENQQSTDDVASAAYAEAVISPLVRYFSDTNMTWSTFRNLKSKPSDAGWKDYLQEKSGNNILVILHDEDSAVVRIGFRAALSDEMLMAAPLYYTEVRFQGRMP